MRRWAERAAVAALLLTGACATATTRRELPSPDSRPYHPRVPRPVPVDTTAPGGLAVGDSVGGIEEEGGTPLVESATSIRVGVLVEASALEVGGPGGLIISGPDGREVARVPAGGSASFASTGGGIAVVALDADGGSVARQVVAAPVTAHPADGGTATLRGNAYRGDIVVQPASGSSLRAVNRVDIESYLLGVVPQEIGPVGARYPEAAKAQAVAARTYAVKHLGARSAQGFDVYASTQDQVYGGVGAEVPLVSEAVRATRGEVLAYGGVPIDAFYHSTCGGQTAAIEEVWNQRGVPYLVSVRDVDPVSGEAYDRISGRYRWTERWTGGELVSILNRTLGDSLRGRVIRQVSDARVVDRTASGRVRRMTVTTDAGTFNLGRDRIRWILLTPRGAVLNSSKFDVAVSRDATGAVAGMTAEGMGWGHGIGMCQFGAIGRAMAGQDYRTIVRTYYPGAKLVRVY
ncbi:MAG TPA: SpoIID/LytB domain-containing protein [Longimicrobiaceae bacterium]|nr:SpoIID/LytB domain-containing protein [Longimicrobiaceae bacterium]